MDTCATSSAIATLRPWLAALACACLVGVAATRPARAADSELLVDPASVPGDELGFALDGDANHIVAGSPGRDGGTGAVDLFDCASVPCAPPLRIDAPDGAAGDRFGAALALDAGTLVVGAPGRIPAAVYVFVQAGGNWALQARIDAPAGPSSAGFGVALDVRGDRLVVGADRADDNAGAVYVFARAGSAWSLEARLVADDAAAGDRLGRALALHEDAFVAGAPFEAGDAPGGYARGAVYLFQRFQSEWSQGPKFAANAAADGDLLGFSVAFDGQSIAAGAPMADARIGATVLFMQAGSTWSQRARLVPPAGVPGDRFGWSVALTPDVEVLVGAPYALDGCGAATLYARTGATWNPTSRATLDAPLAATMAGWAVGVSNQRLAVAAPGHAGALEHRGGVHLFGGGDVLFRDGFELPVADLACAVAKRSAAVGGPGH